MDARAVTQQLDVDPARGLSAGGAAERLRTQGPNKLAGAKKESGFHAFLRSTSSRYRFRPDFPSRIWPQTIACSPRRPIWANGSLNACSDGFQRSSANTSPLWNRLSSGSSR